MRSSKVGDSKTRGISGGEKKRLSIGNELATALAASFSVSSESTDSEKKLIIFADEPTSGLDSFQALKVMQLLKDLTRLGHTVITSIHQPRASVYAMFDEVESKNQLNNKIALL